MSKDEKIGKLADEALSRKRKLEELKKSITGDETSEEKSKSTLPKPKFRSYNPCDETLKANKLPTIGPLPLEESERDVIAKNEPIINEVELSNLAPRKVDWDLKRNITKKLEKLEKRTQRAIAELIRERLKAAENSD